MTVYTCEAEWDAMLTCIYVAWASRKGHKNVKLALEPIGQYSFMEEYVHVDPDPDKARSVMNSIINKISPEVYDELAFSSMAYEEDVLDNIYRVLVLGFAYGPNILKMVHIPEVMRNVQIRKRVGNESHKFVEFLRFHEIKKSVYVAHIEPKSRVVASVATHFADRMPSEHWMIVDDVHQVAAVHPKDAPFYLWKLTNEEFENLKRTESENDEYTDMWKVFFDNIAIKERENPRCQTNLFPKWTRKHAVEFL